VYVVSFRDRGVAVVGTTSNTVTSIVRVGRRPVEVAFDAAGTAAYVTSGGDHTVVVVDAATDRVRAKVPVPRAPLGIDVDGAGAVWAVGSGADRVAVLDGGGPDAVPVAGTPVSFGRFIGTPADDCPAAALRCEDADPFTRDGCDPQAGCRHEALRGLDAVEAGIAELAAAIERAGLADTPRLRRLRARFPALQGAVSAARTDGGLGPLRRALAGVETALERAHARRELGPAGSRLVDVARATRRRLREVGRAG
jgi:YVTN family beta-propeller protein